MKFFFTILFSFGFFAAFTFGCFAIDAWPGGEGTMIAALSEPSGIVWHEGRQTLFVVEDGGTLKEISTLGATLNTWPLAGDFEGITLAENDRYLYIGIENPDSIVEFDLQSGSGELTGKSWDLTPWMSSADPNQGLEGLAYRNGHFLAGLQEDGKIYVFDVNLNSSGDVEHIETLTPYAIYDDDISGIDYSSNTGITYAIFDSDNALIELNAANEIVECYSLPDSAQQEGIAIKTNCMSRSADLYLAIDNGGSPGPIVKYENYPITCLDADSDGVNYNSDCNDYDPSISANQNYYRDADGDGFGTNVATSFCLLTPPAGYVTNASDQNDNDYDNDGSPSGSDCNDADSSISQNQTYYRDIDKDELGDANTTTQACSFSAPGGYVSNASDPADISEGSRSFYINGNDYDIFPDEMTTVQHTDLNYFSDDWHEIIAVGLISKKAYITLARVRGSEVAVTKRVRIKIKKKHTSVSITANLSRNKFTTRFSRGKKYTWKVKSSGSFKR
ncbi:MAG: hypothetical protein UX02_C0005G0039 [Candidatus Moranbacteria bacterium GW2011_GWC1_45_18]|nr:MAG: hypothetical protein UT79_C0005G0039 [Candidatus Moranbacteria bacterium GW2011_GWC2_40_12]KKT32089.1 MAG: hypothetical protein UW19_C0032G0011 [Candidatus Moranbacteria bacterium GW2011_GWF2_44_10]KKT99226.1 MAG: hypothetical protein UX02_C0005G0039 [Candidatus Moranbacteria bacterium GW2011_GWC1_45_18]OGI36830.1 MAG: hypothetical protein A2407_05290 [Candidatus Moranbacteria bacterium RIFOXYC1_FULL_44_8]OGI40176.1 MAG: hypothetical protein A2374_05295 [Candidatus Moranbacteria bacteri